MVFETKEAVSVSAVFENYKLKPIAFIWNGRKYKILAISGFFRDRKGEYYCYHYAVKTQDGNVYEICLSTENMSWSLIRIHSQGDF